MVADYSFIADDFTGASDTLATLARSVDTAILAIDLENLAEFSVVGCPSSLRAMRPDLAREELTRLARYLPRTALTHLKVCSTFDSAPHVGNIAMAADHLAGIIEAEWIAVIGGQPSLGRYCVFGTLFAEGPDGAHHRIDRHPVMCSHPVTPMGEADLRLHLGAQGWNEIGLISGIDLAGGAEHVRALIDARRATGECRTLFDVWDESHVAVIGTVLREICKQTPVLAVGSSSIAEAWCGLGKNHPACEAAPLPGGPVFGFAGSRSSVTKSQVAAAKNYETLHLDPDDFLPGTEAVHAAMGQVGAGLEAGQNMLVALTERPSAISSDPERVAELTGDFVAQVLRLHRPGRLALAGGDTSSVAMQNSAITHLEYLGDFQRGVPLLRIGARDTLDGTIVILKGGQMGQEDIFDQFASL